MKLYIDEDAMDGDFVRVLRARGADVVTAVDAGMICIILAQRRRYSFGEQIRRVIRVMNSFTAEQMKNREEFLSAW